MSECCANCKFVTVGVHPAISTWTATFMCRRHPPAPQPSWRRSPEVTYPTVGANNWCGEWQQGEDKTPELEEWQKDD